MDFGNILAKGKELMPTINKETIIGAGVTAGSLVVTGLIVSFIRHYGLGGAFDSDALVLPDEDEKDIPVDEAKEVSEY